MNIELNELVVSSRAEPPARARRAERLGRNRRGRNARPEMMRRHDPLHAIDHVRARERRVQRRSSLDEKRDDRRARRARSARISALEREERE